MSTKSKRKTTKNRKKVWKLNQMYVYRYYWRVGLAENQIFCIAWPSYSCFEYNVKLLSKKKKECKTSSIRNDIANKVSVK